MEITETPSTERDKGFTLIELLIVIVILGILATVTVFAVSGITNRGNASACQADKKTIETAAEAYFAQHNAYPAGMGNMVPGFLNAVSSKHTYASTGPTNYSVTPITGQC